MFLYQSDLPVMIDIIVFSPLPKKYYKENNHQNNNKQNADDQSHLPFNEVTMVFVDEVLTLKKKIARIRVTFVYI